MASEKLQAIPTKDPSGTIQWKLCDANNPTDCGALGNNPVTSLKKSFFAKTYKFEITITNDQTGMGLKFAPNSSPTSNDGPLWVQAGQKPTTAMLDSHIPSVTGAGTTKLEFLDKNKGNPVDLIYVLNFVDGQGQKVTAIDPEIKNGGSTIGLELSALNLVFALVVGTALILGAIRLLNRK